MKLLSDILVYLVAIECLGIMLFEMFGNQTDAASKAFNVSKNILHQNEVKTLMQNQGLYNGFLGFGILISKLFISPNNNSTIIMFLIFIIIAAIFGAITASKKIIITQGMPAIISLIVLLII